jgi:hypothetical protein
MIHNTCPCCEIGRLPHLDGCTFHADAPEAAGDFDEVLGLRAEIPAFGLGWRTCEKGWQRRRTQTWWTTLTLC